MTIVWLLLAAAISYLGWSAYRTVAGKKSGCGSGCGSCKTTTVHEPAKKGRVSLPQI